MASSDDFKALLKAGNITEALALALSEAVELKFTTWVPSEEDAETDEAKPGHRLRTRINMIEGEVEHEIGEEFIGTGRYRDLKQFHLEQVAEGSKLIQNNLKSLQKLIEVLVALRYPETKTPVIEPESPERESQPLLPVETGPDAGLTVESQEATVADSLVSPDTVTEEDIPVAGLVVAPPAIAVVDSLVSPDTEIEKDSPLEPSPLSEQPASSLTAPTEHEQVIEEEPEEEDDDDWDNSVLDLLESLPVVPPPSSETSETDLRENLGWADLVEEESAFFGEESDSSEAREWETTGREDLESLPATEAQTIEETTTSDFEDLRDLVKQESVSETEQADLQHEWDLESPPAIESLTTPEATTPVDEDLRDLVEDESASLREQEDSQQEWDLASPSATESIIIPQKSAKDEDEWGDFVEDESTSQADKPIPNLDSLDLEEDEEWDDWVMEDSEPTVETSLVDMDSLDLGEEEDWGDLVDDSNSLTPTPSLGEPTSSLDSDEDWDDFTSEELELSPHPIERRSHTNENFDLFESLDDLAFAESESSTDPSSVEKRPQVEDSDWSEESELGVSEEHSDTLAGSGEDADAKPKSAGRRMPPPPPPNPFPRPE